MKHIFALGTVIVSGALLAAACTVTDDDADPDTTPNSGGSGGSAGSGGSTDGGGSGGTSSTGNTTSTANTVGSTSTTGSGGTYASGGTDSGAGGWAGEDGTTGERTTTTSTSTTGGGGTTACLGDDEVEAHELPDCDDLSYAAVECPYFKPPEPFGVTHCKQFAAHATPEAFVAMFECLDAIDVENACGDEDDTAHDDAVRLCRDGNLEDHDETNDGVIPLTCPSDLAREKCANMGCPEIDTEVDGTCDVYLSAFTPSGVDHVIACTNEFTEDETGGAWGAGPDTTGCGDVFLECVVGLRQPH